MAGSESGPEKEGVGSLVRWVWLVVWSLQRAVGPVAAVVLWAAVAFQLYVSYLTHSLLFFPLGAVLVMWSYGVYGLVAWRLRIRKPKWYMGPVLVSGLAFLASDVFFAYIALHGGGGSTNMVVFGIAPFLQVLVILPIASLCGFLLQAAFRAAAKALLRGT